MKLFFLSSILLICSICNAQSINTLNVDDFENKIKADSNIQLLDVRTADEFTGGHLRNAKNIDVNDATFEEKIKVLDHNKPTFVYCLSGGRSKNACAIIAKNGFENIYNMDGGVMAWRAAAKSLVTDRQMQINGMTMDSFKEMVKKDKPVLVEFYAPWCGPCKILKPQVEQIGKDNADKMIVQFVNIDEHKLLGDALKIKSIPMLMYFENGKKKWEIVGLPKIKSLKRKLRVD